MTLATCRTSSRSVHRTEKRYKHPFKHCFGAASPPSIEDYEEEMEVMGVSVPSPYPETELVEVGSSGANLLSVRAGMAVLASVLVVLMTDGDYRNGARHVKEKMA